MSFAEALLLYHNAKVRAFTYTAKGWAPLESKPDAIAVEVTVPHLCKCPMVTLLRSGCKCGGR